MIQINKLKQEIATIEAEAALLAEDDYNGLYTLLVSAYFKAKDIIELQEDSNEDAKVIELLEQAKINQEVVDNQRNKINELIIENDKNSKIIARFHTFSNKLLENIDDISKIAHSAIDEAIKLKQGA